MQASFPSPWLDKDVYSLFFFFLDLLNFFPGNTNRDENDQNHMADESICMSQRGMKVADSCFEVIQG